MASFIVNHGGVVQAVNDEELDLHLGLASIPPSKEDPRGKPARMATHEEIAAWKRAHGVKDEAEAEAEAEAGKPASAKK